MERHLRPAHHAGSDLPFLSNHGLVFLLILSKIQKISLINS